MSIQRETAPKKSFESIGMLDVNPERNSTQEILVNPTKAKFLKLRINSLTEQANKTLEIMELYVYGFDPDKQGMSPPASAGIEAGKVLFQDDFSSGLTDRWEIWDDASATPQKSQWDIVLTEYAGIKNPLRVPASLLTAGEKNWVNYSVRSHLFIGSRRGNLTGVVFDRSSSTSITNSIPPAKSALEPQIWEKVRLCSKDWRSRN
jgi:hypothetical protein